MKNVMPEAQHPVYKIPQGLISEIKFAKFGPNWDSNT
jgi:hypothetical protein